MTIVQGIDCSRWQGAMNWAKAKSAGAQFAIIRAGSVNSAGECYKDIEWDRNISIAPEYMPIGSYWYFRPGQNPIAQSDFYLNLLRTAAWKITPSMDLEEHNNLPPDKVMSAAWVFCNEIEKEIKKVSMPYSSPGFWDNYVKPAPWFAERKLWVAHWNVTKPYLPREWRIAGKPYTFWQTHVGKDAREYGASASISIDHNVYNGTWEQFCTEFEIEITPPPPPPVYTHEQQHELLLKLIEIHDLKL